MAIALVQSAVSQASSTGSINLSFSSPVAAGNTVVVFTTSWFQPSTSCVDNQSGNSYVQPTGAVASPEPYAKIYVAKNVNSSGTFTITATYSGTADVGIVIAEFSGVDNTTPYEVGNNNTGSDAAPTVSTSATTTDANDVLIGVMGHDASTMALTETYTLIREAEDNSIMAINAQYRALSSTGTFSLDWATASAASWHAVLAALKPAAGGGAVEQPIARRVQTIPFASNRIQRAGV